MERVIRYGLTGVAFGGILLIGWGSMKLVTPSEEKMLKKYGPISDEERNARNTHTEQLYRFLQANARSDNPVWKFDPPPQMPSFAPKSAQPRAQQELTARNSELKRQSEEKKKRGIKPGSKSDKLIKEIESVKLK